MERGSACNLLECCYKRQLPNPLSYTTVVMTCAFSLQLQTVMHTHLYWLAAKDTDEEPSGRRAASTPRLCALFDIEAKQKIEMCKSHRLGSAKTDTGFYNYWKDLSRPLVNKQGTNAFWNNSNLKFYEKRNVMRYRTGTIQSKTRPPVRLLSHANCPICPYW